ncbi:hypothetical protein CDL12_25904 [Handroanthus impetiginosus]|uniref:Uncharacterized protein n=1 Tax=Handroanthus impetiginosus TaxID=429701 RepID=A0A2G9G8G7_9LAMI|nr:hypothetical protein CDL12_25904 [Handroanthus impetiginosus]
MTHCLIWNTRGIGNHPSQRMIHQLVKKHRIQLLAILEPKVQLHKRFFVLRLGFADLLHVEMQSATLPRPIFASIVYAHCTKVGIRPLWEDLKSVAQHVAPWFVASDFNIVLQAAEKIGGPSPTLADMEKFREMVFDCHLENGAYEGSPYTWIKYST